MIIFWSICFQQAFEQKKIKQFNPHRSIYNKAYTRNDHQNVTIHLIRKVCKAKQSKQNNGRTNEEE